MMELYHNCIYILFIVLELHKYILYINKAYYKLNINYMYI